MRSALLLVCSLALLLPPFMQAQLQWSKQGLGGSFFRTDRADFNGDGYPDVLDYLEIEGSGLIINSGTGSGIGGSGLPQFIVSAAYLDFNRDNKLDIAACDGDYSLLILLGDGAGHMTQTLTIPDICTWVVAGDFNRDGNPDFAVGGRDVVDGDTANKVFVYLGDGHGNIASEVVNENINFTSSTGVPCSVGPAAQAADFTGDKIPDIFLIASCQTAPAQFTQIVVVGKGDGTGHFTFHKDIEGKFSDYPLRLLDENQDGATDLIVSSNNALTIFNGRGDGTFTIKNIVQTSYSAATNSGELLDAGTVADFDGDGIKDAMVAIENYSPPYGRFLRFYKGQSNGSYKATQTFSIEVPVYDMNWGDFDKDGRADISMSRPGSPYTLWLNKTPSAPICKSTTLRSVTACILPSAPGVLHFVASPRDGLAINAIQIYVDGNLKFQTPEDLLNVTLPISDGQHRVTVKAWDDRGAFSYTTYPSSCNNTANRTVKICNPPSGTGLSGTAHIIASAATNLKFSALQVYIGGVLKYSFNSKAVDFIADIKPGDNRITVKGWDSDGAFSSTVTINAE